MNEKKAIEMVREGMLGYLAGIYLKDVSNQVKWKNGQLTLSLKITPDKTILKHHNPIFLRLYIWHFYTTHTVQIITSKLGLGDRVVSDIWERKKGTIDFKFVKSKYRKCKKSKHL